MSQVVSELAHYLPLVPLAWLVWLGWRGEHRDVAWWWLAGAFLISWLSNTAQHYLPEDDRWIASAVYPIPQAVLVGAVFLPRQRARQFLAILTLTGVGAVLVFGLRLSTIPLRLLAWGGVVWFVWPLPVGRLRIALLVTFGGALLGWLAYMLVPGTPTWAISQSLWAAGITLFCVAAWHPAPKLRLA